VFLGRSKQLLKRKRVIDGSSNPSLNPTGREEKYAKGRRWEGTGNGFKKIHRGKGEGYHVIKRKEVVSTKGIIRTRA